MGCASTRLLLFLLHHKASLYIMSSSTHKGDRGALCAQGERMNCVVCSLGFLPPSPFPLKVTATLLAEHSSAKLQLQKDLCCRMFSFQSLKASSTLGHPEPRHKYSFKLLPAFSFWQCNLECFPSENDYKLPTFCH